MAVGELFDLTGKVAVITGSSKGIGKAIAHRMAEHGANVVISSRKADVCEAARDEINKLVGREAAISVPANISDKAQLQMLVDKTMEKWGHIDICVCNAATNPYLGPLVNITDEAFEKVLKNNIIANHWLITMVAPQMRERKDGVIIVISSVGGLRGGSAIGAYNISKAADMQLTRNYAAEFARDNVRVNTIAPGLVKTDFARALWDRPERANAPQTARRTIGEPDDIAGMAVLLAGKAGLFANGQTFVIDGGSTSIG
jgi:NAD(P)-dependent dehydrogenase (short-subunit alcohol dehydrogenase family)